MRALCALLSLLTVLTPGAAVAGEARSARAEAARRALRERLRADDISGMSAAVAVHGQMVWSEAFGDADREAAVPATPATQLGIGSITKSLTMALAARPVDQGRLDLDAPVEEYLPGFPWAGRGITTRLIGGHLSGLGDDFASASRLTTRHYDTPEALVQIVKDPPRGPAGVEHFYATGSYTVIAAVIEAVTGEESPAALRRHVLDPLEMHSTVPNHPRRLPAHRATFYETDAENRPVARPRTIRATSWQVPATSPRPKTSRDSARRSSSPGS